MPITLTESDYASRMYALAQSEGHVKKRDMNLDKYIKCIDGVSVLAFNAILEEDIIEYLEAEGPKTVTEIRREYGCGDSALRKRLRAMEKQGRIERVKGSKPMQLKTPGD